MQLISEGFYHDIVHHSPDAIVVLDDNGYVQFINPATETLFQRDRADLIGQAFGFPLVSGECVELDLILKGGSRSTAEMRVTETYWDGERAYLAMLRDISDRKKAEVALREAQEELQALYRSAPLAIVALCPDWHIKLWNPAAERIFGWSDHEVVGKAFPLIPPTHAALLDEVTDRLNHGASVVGRDSRLLHKDGTLLDISLSMAPFHDDSGKVSGAMCILEDISERVRANEKLGFSAKIFENSQEGIFITDAEGLILTVNRAFTSITGYTEDEVVGNNPRILNSGYQDAAFYQAMWLSLSEYGSWSGEIWNRRKNGEIYPEWLNISRVCHGVDSTTHFVAIFLDITEIKKHEKKLQELALFDVLTGLPNRFLFQDRLNQALKKRKNENVFAVMFLDLDRFKIINDTLGHTAGDELLVQVGERLSNCVRSSDTVSRFGGDEFNIILSDVDTEVGASLVAQKILQSFVEPFVLEHQNIFVSASIGISLWPKDGELTEQLMRAADTAMYEAKEHGGNTYRYYDDMKCSDRMSRRFMLEHQLRGALERKEFQLYYQPLINLSSRQLYGVEALIRWRHPERGLISPAEFIPIAEEIGFICTLGQWVLREACHQNKMWQTMGLPPVRVAVNLSPLQLRDNNLPSIIDEILSDQKLDPHWLELELTESAVMHNVDRSVKLLSSLKSRGVGLSVDDFGTGLSSLSYLKRLPINALKIDRTFIADVPANANDATIAKAIIAMAHSLKLRVVAEGVESAEQLALLYKLHCKYAQGYLFGKPVPADEMGIILSRRSWDVDCS